MTTPNTFAFNDDTGARSITLGKIGISGVGRISHFRTRNCFHQQADHVHNGYFEIELCLNGRTTYLNNGESYHLSAGTLLVNKPGIPHRIVSFPKSFEHYGICVSVPTRGCPLLGFTLQETVFLFRRLRAMSPVTTINVRQIHRTFRDLFTAYDGLSGMARTMRMKTLMMALLTEVVEMAGEPGTSSEPSRLVRIREMADEMARSPEKSYPLSELASRAFLSVQGFSAQFRQVTGYSPHVYLVQCRITAAKRLLRRGVQVAAVGDMLGFSSPAHFSSAFRRMTGCSPTAFMSNPCLK